MLSRALSFTCTLTLLRLATCPEPIFIHMNTVKKEHVDKLSYLFQLQFACFCAKQVLHLVKEEHKAVCTKTIEVAEAFVAGGATKEECVVAANAAANAAHKIGRAHV